MWKNTYAKTYKNISKHKIWELWTDVNNWNKFDSDIEYCKMTGDFEVGNHFTLKPKGATEVKIDIIQVDDLKSFTDCTKFFGAKMYGNHTIEEVEGGIKLTVTMSVKGLLSLVWVKLVAKKIAANSQDQLDRIARLAEV